MLTLKLEMKILLLNAYKTNKVKKKDQKETSCKNKEQNTLAKKT